MAVKCNIAKQALDKYQLKQWGFAKDVKIDRSILFNYLEYIKCEGVEIIPCEDDSDCAKAVLTNKVVKRCNMNLISMSVDVLGEDNQLVFSLKVGNVINGTPPYVYQWIWDTDKLELVEGESTDEEVKIKPIGDADVSLMMFPIILQVTDANGCSDEKTCYYTPSGMKCNNNYVPCYPLENLVVSMINIPCYPVNNLIVNNS